MGALHSGHTSLFRAAKEGNDIVVASVFVNPLQFGPKDDFDRYPRNLDRDISVAEGAGVDYLFAPATAEMYPKGELQTMVEVGRIGQVLEGLHRPGHFDGVATVCVKLFNIVQPDRAYLGQKDAQQAAVIRRVVRDLDLPVEIVVCPTIREPDGLAASSRNAYLSPKEREAAAALPQALGAASDLVSAGEDSAARVAEAARTVLVAAPGVRPEYVEVVDPRSFEPVQSINGEALIALAAHVGETRLIDNVVVAPVTS